jgi:O-Antigen ligase
MATLDYPRPAGRGFAAAGTHWSARGWVQGAAAITGATAIGFLLTRSEPLALTLVGCVTIAAVAVLAGRLAFTQLTLAALPWFVVFADLMPPLVKTFTSAVAVIAVLMLVSPIRSENAAVKAGAFLFLATLMLAVVTAKAGNELIQASKYVLFPAIAYAVTTERAPVVLPRLRRALLASGVLALSTHVLIILAGAGAVGTKYGTGERLGFASSSAHNLALMSMIVATAGLTTAKRNGARFAYLCLGTLPVIASGVRSALIAVVAVGLIFLFQSRFSLRALLLVGGVAVVVAASGLFTIVESRYQFDQSKGEFTTFSTAGSGRGSVWSLSLRHWRDSGPSAWAGGTGLRSIERFQEEETGNAVVGHSDVIEVLVQLGVIGFIGWLLLWIGLLRAGLNRVVLVPIAVYAVANGSIEYVDSLVFGIVLAAASVTVLAADRSVIRRGVTRRPAIATG